jgi:hypothetical protein
MISLREKKVYPRSDSLSMPSGPYAWVRPFGCRGAKVVEERPKAQQSDFLIDNRSAQCDYFPNQKSIY